MRNMGLKMISLFLALALWFYVVSELKKGSVEETQLLSRMLPTDEVVAKKLTIKPILVGRPRAGYNANITKTVVIPEYCIVVGTRDLLGKIRFAYTMPVDIKGTHKSITTSVPLNPIAPGVFMEETSVQVTVPIEKSGG